MNPEQTKHLPTCSETHEGINYISESNQPSVFTRLNPEDINSHIRCFFGANCCDRNREFNKVDSGFVATFCKWNINRRWMPNDH